MEKKFKSKEILFVKNRTYIEELPKGSSFAIINNTLYKTFYVYKKFVVPNPIGKLKVIHIPKKIILEIRIVIA